MTKTTNVHVAVNRFAQASPDLIEKGLLGYLTVTMNDAVIVDGITLRRTAEDRLTLSFPERRDGQGRPHPIVRPVNDHARRDFEAQVLAALGMR